MAIIKLSAAEQRRLSLFFTCVILSAVAWVIVTLSNTYDFTVRQAITYKNVPQRRAFHSLQPDTVNITEKGSGWQMLFSKIQPLNEVIKVDMSSLESKNYIALHTQLTAINGGKEVNNKIISFDPDTLYFDFSNRSTKKVPVQLLASFKFQRQFTQSGNIVVKPAYVTISGPSGSIDNIMSWHTDSLKMTGLDGTARATVGLEPVKEGNISIYPKNVSVTVPVNEFTEKTIEVPVKLVNNNNFYSVKLYPQKVKVTFTISLNRYAETNEDLFEATADLDLWKDHNYHTLPILLTKLPAYCKIVKVEPRDIDFIIKK